MQICRITSVLLLSNYNFVLGGKRKSGSELTLPDSVIYGFVLLFRTSYTLPWRASLCKPWLRRAYTMP